MRSLARFSTITHMPASMRRFLSALPLLGLLWFAIASSCNCGSHKASGTARCDIDLSPFRGAGVGAVARVITSTADLMQGDSATGRVGDYLIQNELIRVIVQAPDRHIQPNPFGGAIIDADIVRVAGEASSDQFGKVAPFYNFGRTTNVERVEVLDAGGKGAAIIAATGHDDVNDYLNVKSILPLTTVVQADTPVPMRETTYYFLRPGERRVHLVTAFCNDTGQAQKLAVGDLIDSGGDVEFFNPRSATGGFGYVPGLDGISPFPFYAFWGHKNAYAYLPPTADNNAQVTVSGVVGMLVGTRLDEWIGAAPPEHAFLVPAHGKAEFERDFVVGRDLAEVTGDIYALRGATVQLSGKVTLDTAPSQPVAGARVVAVDLFSDIAPHPASVTESASDGTWSLRLPPGNYRIGADLRFVSRSPFREITATADQGNIDFSLTAPVTAHVQLKDPAGSPIPGKVVVYCAAAGPAATATACPFPRGAAREDGNLFRYAAFDPWGDTVQSVVFVDHTGSADVELPAGQPVAFVASHGPEWSVSPDSWPADLGTASARTNGETVSLELAHVVNTTGWISGDFHVHGVNSPDSPIALLDRVRTFLGEGVDVLVATDHDYITDYGPYLSQLDGLPAPANAKKASAWLRTVVGEELTTFDYGHWNSFPLDRNDSDLIGGAVDWAGGTGANKSPKEIHQALRDLPGGAVRVVQANHPRGNLGWFTHVRLDTGDGATHACPQQFRISGAPGCDPAKGSADDTALFDEGFTSMEIVNDFEEQRIHGRVNDWFTFLSRGLVVTATSVSDTHHKVLVSAGYGRSYVNVGTDDPATLDLSALAQAVNQHKVVASTGAFATLTATNAANQTAQIGDLIASGGAGQPMTFHAHVETAKWLQPWQLELHTYSAARRTQYDADGTQQDDIGNNAWPGYCASPATGVACDAPNGNEAAELGAVGVQADNVGTSASPPQLAPGFDPAGGHQRWIWDHDFTVTPAQDTWYVLVVRRDPAKRANDIAPAVGATNGGGTAALSIMAVTNPIFVDVDGNGKYDAPAAKTPRATPWPLRANVPIDWAEALRRSRAIELEK